MGNQKKKKSKQFLKFSNIALQMGMIIYIGTSLGAKIDQYYNFEIFFTIFFSIVSVLSSMIFFIYKIKND